MRVTTIAALSTLVLLLAPVPVLAQVPNVPNVPAAPALPAAPDVPGAPALPAAPDFTGSYQGVPYYVVDGIVHRVDGQKVDPSAAGEVLKAKRVADLLNADPAFATRLLEREAALGALDGRVDELQAAATQLQSVVAGIGAADAEGLLGGLLGQLPIRPVDLVTEANDAKAKVDDAHAAVSDVQAKSADVRSKLESFQGTGAVEDKRALVDSMASAVPAYRAAADKVASAEGRVKRAAADAQSSLDAVKARSESFLFGLGTDTSVPTDLAGAVGRLQSTAADLQSFASGLKSDAAFMESIAHEPVDSSFPVAWVVGGGAGAAGLGLGSLYLIRRKIGLP